MTYRRSKFEVYVDLLFLVKDGVHKPTVLMQRANLSWVPLMGVIGLMIEFGHVREVDPSLIRSYKYGPGRDGRTSKLYELTQEGGLLVAHLRHAGLLKLIEGIRK